MSSPIPACQNAYSALWNAFTNAAGKHSHLTVEPRGVIVKTKKGGAVVAESMFFLPQWPFKAVSAKRQVDVVVRVLEALSDDCKKILTATTNLGYYSRVDDSLSPRLTVHYDFEHDVREAHPVFHLQVGTPRWSANQLANLGLRVDRESAVEGALTIERAPGVLAAAASKRDSAEDFDDAEDVANYGQARVPTAFVGFAQVLLALAADHLEPRSFRQVLKKAKEVASQIPKAQCDHFDGRVAKGQFPAITDWYDERYEVRVKASPNKVHANVTALAIKFEAKSHQDMLKRLEKEHRIPEGEVCVR